MGGWGGQSPPQQNLLTNGLNPYSGFTFQVQLLRSLHVYAISEVNAYTPVLVITYWNTEGARAPQTPPVNSSGNIIVFQMGRFTSHNLLEHWGARAPRPPLFILV